MLPSVCIIVFPAQLLLYLLQLFLQLFDFPLNLIRIADAYLRGHALVFSAGLEQAFLCSA